MPLSLSLPTIDGRIERYTLSEVEPWRAPAMPAFNRIAFSAAHVVADARAANDPWLDCGIDWELGDSLAERIDEAVGSE